jgi:hypothetical protein
VVLAYGVSQAFEEIAHGSILHDPRACSSARWSNSGTCLFRDACADSLCEDGEAARSGWSAPAGV